jgi:hypothetical protein
VEARRGDDGVGLASLMARKKERNTTLNRDYMQDDLRFALKIHPVKQHEKHDERHCCELATNGK